MESVLKRSTLETVWMVRALGTPGGLLDAWMRCGLRVLCWNDLDSNDSFPIELEEGAKFMQNKGSTESKCEILKIVQKAVRLLGNGRKTRLLLLRKRTRT